MVFLGILSFIQISFLPGFLVIRSFKKPGLNIVQTLTFSLALSLLINYLFIFIFVSLKIFLPVTVYILLLLEFLYFVYLIIKEFKKKSESINIIRPSGQFNLLKKVPVLNTLIIFFAIVVFLVYIFIFFKNLGSIFDYWDDIFSWNRWAVD